MSVWGHAGANGWCTEPDAQSRMHFIPQTLFGTFVVVSVTDASNLRTIQLSAQDAQWEAAALAVERECMESRHLVATQNDRRRRRVLARLLGLAVLAPAMGTVPLAIVHASAICAGVAPPCASPTCRSLPMSASYCSDE